MKMGKNMQRNKKWAQRIQKKCGEFLCFFLLLFGSEWCADSDQKMYITCRHDNCVQRCLGCCLEWWWRPNGAILNAPFHDGCSIYFYI